MDYGKKAGSGLSFGQGKIQTFAGDIMPEKASLPQAEHGGKGIDSPTITGSAPKKVFGKPSKI